MGNLINFLLSEIIVKTIEESNIDIRNGGLRNCNDIGIVHAIYNEFEVIHDGDPTHNNNYSTAYQL